MKIYFFLLVFSLFLISCSTPEVQQENPVPIIPLDPEGITFCNQFDGSERDLCFFNLALQEENSEGCKYVMDEEGKEFCESTLSDIQENHRRMNTVGPVEISVTNETITQQVLDDLGLRERRLSFPTMKITNQSYIIWRLKNTKNKELIYAPAFEFSKYSVDNTTKIPNKLPELFPTNYHLKPLQPGSSRIHVLKVEENYAPAGYYLYKLTVKDEGEQEIYDSRAFFKTIEE